MTSAMSRRCNLFLAIPLSLIGVSATACEDDSVARDPVGLTELHVTNDTDRAIAITYEAATPEADTNQGELVIPANQEALLLAEWSIGGWLQPEEMLTSIEIQVRESGEVLYTRRPIAAADWVLAEGSDWQSSRYTLTVPRTTR